MAEGEVDHVSGRRGQASASCLRFAGQTVLEHALNASIPRPS
jgi:hypothetical protein